MLIALYRFWLRKGSDQQTLALLIGKNETQSDVSYYLDRIRKLIYRDFVPHFLGANKGKESFLTHNIKMTNLLNVLNENDLVLVADGTYTRLEKSANNDFQYNSYSTQKKDSLIKPFIICAADGYIVDCYGPFFPRDNDATILRYVIDYDPDLRDLIDPNHTNFLLDLK
jgi:hypothetical protein